MQSIYFDHNATTPQSDAVTRAMVAQYGADHGNPSSVHAAGRRSREALERARRQVAALIGAEPSEILFTSGATEANNLALQGRALAAGGKSHLVISSVEHPSVLKVAEALAAQGSRITRIAVDRQGRVQPKDIQAALTEDTALVSVMLANNETGVVQPIREIAAITRQAGVPLHVDAVQAVGRMPFSVDELGLDLLSLSGHKIFGPRGIGALYVRHGLALEPRLYGGGQEANRRGGTENWPGAVGLGEAARLASKTAVVYREEVETLRDRLEAALIEVWPGAVVHGGKSARIGNTSLIGFPGLDGEAAVMRLDLEGIAVSLGSACATGTMRPSSVLAAMGVREALAASSLRFSLGPQNTAAEVDETVRVFCEILLPVTSSARCEIRT